MAQMKRWRHPSSIAALFYVLSIWLLVVDSAGAGGAGGLPDLTPDAVRSSDLVIIGRVDGLVDQKPGAMQRKPDEAHWIDIITTLKGSDETGERFLVLPGGQLWQDGNSYVMFLEWVGGNIAKSRYLPAIEATENNVAFITREIVKSGAGPTPRRTYWLRYIGGWQLHAAIEFIVTADARFTWLHRPTETAGGPKETILRGKLPVSVLDTLMRRAEMLPTGVAGDDEGKVTVRWRDTDSKIRTKDLGSPSGKKVMLLLQEIETLARRHG